MYHVSTDFTCVKVTRKLIELASFRTKDIVEVKASAIAPLTSSKDTSKDTTESYARVEVSSTSLQPVT